MFQKKTVDSILAGFNKTIANLSQLVEENDKKVTGNELEIQHLRAMNESTNAETNRAEMVHAKLLAIVGD